MEKRRIDYDGHSEREIRVWAAYRAINARSEAGLPGDVEPGTNRARLMFGYEGRTAVRYFKDQATAYRTKKDYRGSWSTFNLQTWDHKDKMWV